MAEFIDLSIVIPAFNEERRLPAFLDDCLAWCRRSSRNVEILVVNDGSSDRTADVALGRSTVRVINLERNSGKGAAVRTGMLNARGRLRLFADADGATPIAEISRLEEAVAAGADVAIGSRIGTGITVRTSKVRRLVGRGFNTAVRLGGVRGIKDTQCGFKLFTTAAAQRLFGASRENGYAFDVELLFLARKLGLGVAEVPVNWAEMPGSKVRVARDGLSMVGQIMRMRWRWWVGGYRAEQPDVMAVTQPLPENSR